MAVEVDAETPQDATHLTVGQQQQLQQENVNDAYCLQEVEAGLLRVPELKDRLRARGLVVSGVKAQLVHRLLCYLKQEDLPYNGPLPAQKRKAYEMEMPAYDMPLGPPAELDAGYAVLGNGLTTLDRQHQHHACEHQQASAGPSKRLAGEETGHPGVPTIVERRTAPWRAAPPADVKARLQRALKQRFFMIERYREGDELREEFKILGSTGNVYTVTIDKTPKCTCPDQIRSSICKHMIFVFIRVLGQSQHTSPFWYQRGLLHSELAQIFAQARPAPRDPQAEAIRKAYLEATGRGEDAAAIEPVEGKKKPLDDDASCPICYEDLKDDGKLWWCGTSCGNALHSQCFAEWKQAARTKGQTPTCPWCRADIVDAVAPVAGPSKGPRYVAGGYVNLASAAGISGRRDTSDYYAGPRRGMTIDQARMLEESYGYDGDDYGF